MQDKTSKISVTLRIDSDILDAFKALAETTPGTKYQTLMNEALRQHIIKEKIGGLEERLSILEEIVLKKKGIRSFKDNK